MEDGTADPGPANVAEGRAQMVRGGNAEDYQVAGVGGLIEAVACLDARMAHLDDLIGERNVRADQDVDVARGNLRISHGKGPRAAT